jgi:2-C-methyl-D-erythritol 4-phosphate cytidylyltransferase
MLCAIIVAAGSSQRMGFDKLFADLGGRPVLAWSVSAFQECAAIDAMVIVARPEKEPALRELAERWQWTKLRAILAGGAQRHLSVWNGLQTVAGWTAGAAPGQETFVAVQDGARPLVTPGMISRCLEAAKVGGAACCAAPVSDTLKRADGEGRISGSVDRANLWAMQTPQIFRLADLQRAYQNVLDAGLTVTDEASALERMQQPVTLVHSGDFNWKITYPEDLDLARHLLAMRGGGCAR